MTLWPFCPSLLGTGVVCTVAPVSHSVCVAPFCCVEYVAVTWCWRVTEVEVLLQQVGQAAHTVAMGCSSRVSLQCSLQQQAVGATTAMVASLRAMSRTVATSLAVMASPPPILMGASMPVAMATSPVLTIQTSSLKGTMAVLPHLKEAMVVLPQGEVMGGHRALTMGHPLPPMEVMVGKVVDSTVSDIS